MAESTERPWEVKARAAKEASAVGAPVPREEWNAKWQEAAAAIPLPYLDPNASDRERISWGARSAEVRERLAEEAPEGIKSTVWNAADIAMSNQEDAWRKHNK